MTTASSTATAGHQSFLRARLASILAIAPLGVWTFFHLLDNLAAFNGGDAWQTSVTTYKSPVSQLFVGILVLVPLVLHTVWGIARVFTSQPNNGRYNAYGNLKYLLQRVAAIGVLFFVGAHLWLAMIHPRMTTGHGEAFADIAHEMHFNPPTLVVYVLGTLGVAYHLGNGLGTFAMSWGITDSKRGLRHANVISWFAFVVLLAMSWAVIYALYRSG